MYAAWWQVSNTHPSLLLSRGLLSADPSSSVRDISHTGSKEGDLKTEIVSKIRGERMRMKGLVTGRVERKDLWDMGLGFEGRTITREREKGRQMQ